MDGPGCQSGRRYRTHPGALWLAAAGTVATLALASAWPTSAAPRATLPWPPARSTVQSTPESGAPAFAIPLATSVANVTPVADTYVGSWRPDNNFCLDPRLWAGYFADPDGPEVRRSLLLFDLPPLAGRTLDAATLQLYLASTFGDATYAVGAYRLTASWSHCGATWRNQPGAAGPYATAVVDTKVGARHDWDLTQLARQWYQGTYANHGVLVRGLTESGNTVRGFHSREATAMPPRLVLRFSDPTATPTPSPTPTTPPRVDIWLLEGCDRSYPIGATLNIRYRSSVAGTLAVYREPGGVLLAQHTVVGGQVYGLAATVGPPAEERRLVARLLGTGSQGECRFTVFVPTPTPSRTPSATRTASPTRTPTRTPTVTRTATRTPTASPTATASHTATHTATATVTLTPTHTATATATATSSHTPTATGTATEPPGEIGGQVVLERRPSSQGAVARADANMTTSGADGRFLLGGLRPGRHRLTLTHPSYLRASRLVTVTAGAVAGLAPVRLLSGDVDQDGRIGLTDGDRLARAWLAVPGDPAWSAELDITADGVVDLLDAVAVRYNWGRVAEDPGSALRAGPAARVVALALSSSPGSDPDSVVLRVLAPAGSSLRAARLVLAHDPDALQIVGVHPGTGWDGQRLLILARGADQHAGRAELAVTLIRPAMPLAGPAELARVAYRRVPGTAGTVRLATAELVGADPAQPLAALLPPALPLPATIEPIR